MKNKSNKEEIQLTDNTLYSGKVISLHVDDVLCPNGNKSNREYVTHNGGVCVLAEIDNKIALVRQYRYAYRKQLLELPAGKLEKGEDSYKAGLRELEEEIGYKAGELVSYGSMYPTCGYSNEEIFLYVAKNCVKTQTNFDIDEDLDLVLLSKEELISMLKNNEIKDAKTVILLSKYLLK